MSRNAVEAFCRIQLVRKELPFAGYSVVKEPPPRPWAARRDGPANHVRTTVKLLLFSSAAVSGVPVVRLRPLGSGGQPSRGAGLASADLACQPSPAYASAPAAKDGGEYRARTGDLLVANQALSQLS